MRHCNLSVRLSKWAFLALILEIATSITNQHIHRKLIFFPPFPVCSRPHKLHLTFNFVCQPVSVVAFH